MNHLTEHEKNYTILRITKKKKEYVKNVSCKLDHLVVLHTYNVLPTAEGVKTEINFKHIKENEMGR